MSTNIRHLKIQRDNEGSAWGWNNKVHEAGRKDHRIKRMGPDQPQDPFPRTPVA